MPLFNFFLVESTAKNQPIGDSMAVEDTVKEDKTQVSVSMANPNYAIYVEGITKTYSNGLVANNNVTFGVLKGEVHALLGENGAGKTTLMKILSGCLSPDTGSIFVDGKKVHIDDAMKAVKLGIGMVHQHLSLIPSFTVTENVALSIPLPGRLKLDIIREKIIAVSKNLGLEIDPDTKIEQLPVGLRQRVEIIRLLCQDVNILVLDEPTSVLTPLEVDELFRIVRGLKEKGKSVIIITHKVKEALAVSDRITIMRLGKVVRTLNASNTNERELASLVVEGFVPSTNGTKGQPGEPALIVKGLNVKGNSGRLAVKGVDFLVRSGEILGIAGVAGNGQKELVEALTGLRKTESGTSIMKCCNLANRPPQFIIKKGVSYITEDKMKRGVILNLSISDNLALKCIEQEPYSKNMIVNQRKVESRAQDLIKRFDIKASDPCANVSSLSGGNIQKLMVARELSNGSILIIAEQPTAGLDVKASEAIHTKLLELRAKGVAVLLFSADLDEIVKLSDRIAVMYDGRIVGEFLSGSLDMQRLAKMMLGSTT